MIAERTSGVKVAGNLTGESYVAGIDDENMSHIIGLFTDLYSDPIRAIIREYGTNANDAQVEAGVKCPIEVTTPGALAPFFKVKDRGVGLDAEDIRRIYSRYGTSTKRATNDQNGMLGLGCKSALTYAQQFTVESVKDGMRTVCSISRENDGVPVFTVVASVPDDGENGTEVIVPAQRIHHDEFLYKAQAVFKYWPEGSVLLNDEPPKRVDGMWLTDDLLLIKRDYRSAATGGAHMVVMGNVSYPVATDQFDPGLPSNYQLIAFVPMGGVTFAPSREALMYHKTTRETLTSIKARLGKALADAVQKEVDKAKTPGGAIRAALQYRDLMGSNAPVSRFKFKGKPMPDRVPGIFVTSSRRARTLSDATNAPNGLAPEYIGSALFVYGYTVEKFTAQHKRKLIQYLDNNGIEGVEWFAMSSDKPQSDWIDSDRLVPWETIRAIKLPRASACSTWRNGRPTGAFDVYIGGSFQHIQADEIDQEEAIYYCRARNYYESREYAHVIGRFDPAATVACVPENRYAKFMRNFPEAKPFKDGVQAAYDAWLSSLTKGQRLRLAIEDSGTTDWLKRLDARKLADPAIRRAIHIYTNVDVRPLLEGRVRFRNVMHAVTNVGDDTAEWSSPLAAYPLLGCVPAYSVERKAKADLYIYMNAAYAAGRNA